MATFAYAPDWGATPSLEPRIKTAKFGDGYEQRAEDGLNTLLPTWKLTFGKRTQAEAQEIYRWFIANKAHTTAFGWAAPGEGTATSENIGTGDGSRKIFGLTHIGRAVTYTGTPSVYVNGVLKTLTTDYTLSAAGVVTFVTAPANGLAVTWTGTYTRKHVAKWTPPKPESYGQWSITAEFREVPA